MYHTGSGMSGAQSVYLGEIKDFKSKELNKVNCSLF